MSRKASKTFRVQRKRVYGPIYTFPALNTLVFANNQTLPTRNDGWPSAIRKKRRFVLNCITLCETNLTSILYRGIHSHVAAGSLVRTKWTTWLGGYDCPANDVKVFSFWRRPYGYKIFLLVSFLDNVTHLQHAPFISKCNLTVCLQMGWLVKDTKNPNIQNAEALQMNKAEPKLRWGLGVVFHGRRFSPSVFHAPKERQFGRE